MWIQSKIEHVRRQPEHIRLRYVIGCVIISMTVIAMLWIFSIKTSFESVAEKQPLSGQVEKPDQETPTPPTGNNAPSLSDWIKK